jgi:hypothetical protein
MRRAASRCRVPVTSCSSFLLPFAAGLLARPWIGEWALRHQAGRRACPIIIIIIVILNGIIDSLILLPLCSYPAARPGGADADANRG